MAYILLLQVVKHQSSLSHIQILTIATNRLPIMLLIHIRFINQSIHLSIIDQLITASSKLVLLKQFFSLLHILSILW